VKLRILVSYHYYKGSDLDKLVAAFSEPPEIFADSGGYSANSLGVDITVDEYAAWLHRWGHLFSAYASLDEIGDAPRSWDNQQALISLGLHPLPVFHGGEEFSWLSRYLGDHDYMALGGMVAKTDTLALRWCVKAFKMAKDAGAVYHGFGQTNQLLLKNLPWYSVDSSSWGAGHRYGTLVLWDDRKGRFVKVPFHDHKAAYTYGSLLRAHGGDPTAVSRKDFCTRSLQSEEDYRADRRMAVSVSVTAWLRLEAWLQARHGAIGPPASAEGTGPKVVLADAPWSVGSESHEGSGLANFSGPKVFLAASAPRPAGQHLEEASEDLGPKVYLAAGGTFSEGDRSHLTEASHGPKVYLANDRNYDLPVTSGPKVFLADARPGMVEDGDLQLASHATGAGPKIYLAEGSWEAHAADVSTAKEP
jgi:hypothetical protein